MTKKVLTAFCGFLVCSTLALGEADKAKLDERIDEARAVLHELINTPDKGVPLDIAAHATCVAVIPGFKKGAFLFGGEYGQGVATCRTKAGGWSAPVFIQMAGASFGLQAGGQSTDLVLVGTNHRSLDDLLKGRIKLGGDIAVAAGPVGRNSQASTTELANADIYAYSRSKGLFAGVDLTGDVVNQNQDDTKTYYGRDISYQQVLNGSVPTPPSAHHFIAAVNEMFKSGRERYPSKGGGGPPPAGVRPPDDRSYADIAPPPPFPWPPPDSSASVEIPQRFIKDAGTIGSVASRLNEALSHAGYLERSYYTVPGGIAIVTRLERINRNGVPYPELDRWFRADAQDFHFSLRDYILKLFGADQGYYRIVVFVLTNKAFVSSNQTVTTDRVIDWLNHGLKTLPPELASMPLSSDDELTALIYEFERPHSGDPYLMKPSDIGAKNHLEGAGILSTLLIDEELRKLK